MKTGISKRFIFIGVLILILATALALPMSVGAASALSYGGKEMSSFWYYDSLKIDEAKAVVNGWDTSRLTKKIIAVIDTGIDYNHEVFDGVLYENDKGEQVGYDARTEKEVPVKNIPDNAHSTDSQKSPLQKHGNAIAGVIAMMIKELGLQDYIKIYPIKANNIADSSDAPIVKIEKSKFLVGPVVKGINQAKKIGASVINLSLGKIKKDGNSAVSDWATNKDLKYALEDVSASALIVAAAGNDGKNSDSNDNNLFYPAAHDGVLGVMAYGENGRLYKESNYGSAYALAAPGEEIYTAKFADGNSYQTMNGTSLAAPIATVAGALLELRYEAEGKSVPSSVDVSRMLRNLQGETVENQSEIRRLDYNTVVTQDFENTQYEYDEPTSLGLSHNGTLGKDDYANAIYMRANDKSTITFIAKINPFGKTDPALESAIEWVEVREDESKRVLGYGLKFDYTPSYIDETVTIVARLLLGDIGFEQKQDVYLSSVQYLVGDVRVTYAKNAHESVNKAPSGGVLYTGETTEFSLTGIQFVNPDKKKTIKWYVDGELAGEGETFKYSPKTTGKHMISARFDDSPIPREFAANVKPFIARPLDLSMFIIGLAIAVAVIAVVTVILVKKNKQVKTKNKIETEIDK